MRNVRYIVAAVALAGTVAGCAGPYYPRYGISQGYYYPPDYAYRPVTWNDYRNYRGIHPGPERTLP